MISDDRLKQLAAQETMREQAEIAKELLVHRKAWSEPVGYLIHEVTHGGRKSWVSLNGLNGFSRDEIIEWQMTQEPLYRKPDTGEV